MRPLDDEEKLACVEDYAWETLRSPFRKQVELLEKSVKEKLTPLTLNGTELNGFMLQNLVYSFIESLNSNKIPQIVTSLENVKQQ